MARKTKVLGFSVAPEIAEQVEELARQEGKTKSELFREMLAAYQAKREEEVFLRLQAKMARRARKNAPFTEKEIDKLVFEDR
jgi:predicted DNA-binding protein